MIKVEGVGELIAKLNEIATVATDKVVARAARKAMVPVAEAARELVPVDSGDLRESIRLAAAKEEGRISAGIIMKGGKQSWEIETGDGDETLTFSRRVDASWRWHFTEFGTSSRPAQPFLRPAFDQNRDAVLQIFTDEIRASIERAAKKKLGPKPPPKGGA